MDSQHVKTFSTDERTKGRLRFASSRKRAKSASADVYRSYKRKSGVAASREERVHHRKRSRKDEDGLEETEEKNQDELGPSTLAEELDLANDRNASEVFGKFYREVWYLVRSLPEVLHHADKIVELFNDYMLSHEDTPHEKTPAEITGRRAFVINHATADIMHLYAVLARDLRHEIHPYLHAKIVPRFLNDLLNPPPPESCEKQPIPLDVSVVEAAFRTLSYIFRYDGDALLSESSEKQGQEPCLESLRQYYGITLAHRRDVVRRLAAETFAPLIRRLKTDAAKKRHLRRVLRALAGQPAVVGSTSAQRLQSDAVDGIAMLCFQVARGVRGKLHSKGQLVVKCVLDCVSGKIDKGSELVKAVAVSFFERLCCHLETKEAIKVLSFVITTASGVTSDAAGSIFQRHLIELVTDIACFRDGQLLKESHRVVEDCIGLLKKLLSEDKLEKLPAENLAAATNLLCTAWKAVPNNSTLPSQLRASIHIALSANMDDEPVKEDSPFGLLMGDLMPYLPPKSGMGTLGSVILAVAAQCSETNPSLAVTMLHSLSSTRVVADDVETEHTDDDDQLLFLSNAQHCRVSNDDKEKLFEFCMKSGESPSDVAIAVKTSSFVAMTTTRGESRFSGYYKRVLNWLLSLIEKASGVDSTNVARSVSISNAIDALAQLSLLAADDEDEEDVTSMITSMLKKARQLVRDHLAANPTSLWAVKASASFVKVLQKFELSFCQNSNEMFELLIPNLHDSNHFRRLHTLEILCSFPKKPFVVDHADLDLAEDLDEEPEHAVTGRSTTNGPTGACNIIEILLSIESSPVYFSKERYISSLISRVEVMGRSGKLPVLYAEAAASELLGLLHVKFSPIWSSAIKGLVALAVGHENCVWPPAHERISALMADFPYQREASQCKDRLDQVQCDPHVQFQLCLDWEGSGGKDPSVFLNAIESAKERGRVSRHRSTDEPTVLESLWKLFEQAPQLLVAHSRTMVPIILQFLHCQYFALHPEDPDARELNLEEHVSTKRAHNQEKRIDRGAIHRRLLSILKAFAAVNGPQQLFQHQLLKSIYMSLLGHPDAAVAQLALSCLLRFKPDHLIPYADNLKNFYAKGKLRDALLQFRTEDEEGRVVQDHRASLIPVLSRILFGRFSARAMEGRSSKDTPSARRSAILSFLSSLCKDEMELYPFIYLAVRPYIPEKYNVMAIELQDESFRESLVGMVEELTIATCDRVPGQVHQGFLNSLEAIISQLGHSAKRFLPAFMSIVLTLAKHYEINDRGQTAAPGNDTENERKDDTEQNKQERGGTVRSLCYKRLAEVFDTFGDTLDLTRYSKALWQATHKSLLLLPTMAISAEKAPALLVLLKTFSSKPTLVKILSDCEEAVPSVLKCFDAGSGMSVVDSCLSFIDNLLTCGATSNQAPCDDRGRCLVKQHVGLLLNQFRHRLGGSKGPSMTWRRELAILCRVSELIDYSSGDSNFYVSSNAESLCSLLVPFLDQGRKSSDVDKTNVLGILNVLVPMIPQEKAVAHYAKLSKLLGPYKTTAGVTTKSVRSLLAALLKTLAESTYVSALQVTDVLGDLCAVSAKRVDEIDFDSVIPALGKLADASDTMSWAGLCSTQSPPNPSILTPIIHCCFHLLFNEDGVVTRSSFRAIKALVIEASEQASTESSVSDIEKERWTKILEGIIVPLTRGGLNVRNSAIRRFFILILRDLAVANKTSPSPNLHGDLAYLVREDEPDLDYFASITHVQLHRRARALQRLRRDIATEEGAVRFKPQSLSHVLLPLALHPVYETTLKSEESFALEGIATVGAIARHLSWSKYNSILWTTLIQFHRHPDQEPYIVALVCSLIDAFHFDVEAPVAAGGETPESSSVWRALEKRFIPKIEELLVKEKEDRRGNKMKVLRPSIVLAMQKLFQKLPPETFRGKLPRLLTVICDALKSKESDARDVARQTLAKIAVNLDISYLADIIRELAITLTVGYQLHVRSATIHSILLKLSDVYKPQKDRKEIAFVPFDKAVPGLMDLIQQDLFGEAQARKDAEGSKVRYVKEAGGSKSANSVELIASMIVFEPEKGPKSAIHALVTPFIERLRTPGLQTRVIRLIKDCLQRIVAGLQRNPTVRNLDVLPYVYTTVEAFVGKEELDEVMEDMDDDADESESDEDPARPLGVSGQQRTDKETAAAGSVVEWRPSMLGTSTTAKHAQKVRSKEVSSIRKVRDGASAPKLTGSGRNGATSAQSGVNDPANISAVAFGLQLLSSFLKRSTNAPVDMLDPFVPMLTTCVCRCRDSEVILLSLKCLGSLLRTELPSLSRCSRSLAAKTLDILTSSGAASNQTSELLQASFKMLTYLMDYDRRYLGTDGKTEPKEEAGDRVKGLALPLDAEQMQILLSFLRGSLVNSDQHNPAIGLTKAIMTRRYMSAELYDLMDTLLELTVRSSKASLRDQSAALIVSFLINYPLSSERLQQHLQQIVLNLQYEYSDGRLSAIALVKMLVEKFPAPVLEEHSELFFLPLAMQLVNDESKECREAVCKVLAKLFARLSTPQLQSLLEYTDRWCDGKKSMQKQLALQLYGLFIDCKDFIKRGTTPQSLLSRFDKVLTNGEDDEWQVLYFALLNLEKMSEVFPSLLKQETSLWRLVVRTMATSRHAWVQTVSSRLVTQHLASLDPSEFGDASNDTSFLLSWPGALYQVARNFCFQLGAPEPIEDLVPLIIKGLTWTVHAMEAFPELCFSEDDKIEEDQDEPETSGNTDKRKKPVLWLLTRLSNIAKPPGTARRQAVFKCFASFATSSSAVTKSQQNLELILEPLLRSTREYKSRDQQPNPFSSTTEGTDAEHELVQDVLALLEENSPDKVFLSAQATVHKRARQKADERQSRLKSEYVLDPEKSAQRRIEKQDREKNRRKRRVDERRRMRGGVAKRRHAEN